MAEVTLTINGQKITAGDKDTILVAAARNGIYIPSLCFMKDCNRAAACRICVVEVARIIIKKKICVTLVREGMDVQTENERIKKARRITLDMICRNHRMICDRCDRYSDCELHALCVRYGVNERDYNPYVMDPDKDKSSPYLIRDTSKCVLCQRCVSACHAQGMDVISVLGRGREKRIAPPIPLAQTDCVGCGQCVRACPTGALTICDDTATIRNLIRQKKKTAIAVLMPSVGQSIGQLFYEKEKQDQTGKVVAMLRKLGFTRVYSGESCQREFQAAEAKELERRKQENGVLPMISQACPGLEHLIHSQYPSLEEHLSGIGTLQSFSAQLARAAYEKEMGESELQVVCINSCTAAKGESEEYMNLTTYELAAMFRRACVSRFTARKVWEEQLKPEPFDPLPMEEGLNSFSPDTDKVDDAAMEVPPRSARRQDDSPMEVRCAKGESVEVTGLANIKPVLEKIAAGMEAPPASICPALDGAQDNQRQDDPLMKVCSAKDESVEPGEMFIGYVCPGGCINGGGAPRLTSAATLLEE
ncbi:MAG: 2Fe-2S iron-sulfur cluster-binding protein [Lachnospiraceae bacterium]|nr:2Fe-2S iron-sulfur cluster-binding protein [Lachnospiraceae bacterium]